MQEVVINNIAEDDVLSLAAKLISIFDDQEVIYLNGELGSGKTSIVRSVMESLGYAGKVKSPSYSIVETYDFNNIKVAHLDLYRVDNLDELLYLAIDEYIDECDYIFIEWAPENHYLVPSATMKIHISITDSTRNYIVHHNKNINLANILQ
mgnify:CR=1 FL=1|jgi:tRNA threonylcarbamoyladenosine biosynthesis protein TsaE